MSNGFIKKQYPLFARINATKSLRKELPFPSSITTAQIEKICNAVIEMAVQSTNGVYPVIGGYSAEQQLFDIAVKIAYELDAQDKLVGLGDTSETKDSDSSESEIEDVHIAIDVIAFSGSEKQIKWAQSIAHNNAALIAALKLKSNELPTSAKWWIENRHDVHGAFNRER